MNVEEFEVYTKIDEKSFTYKIISKLSLSQQFDLAYSDHLVIPRAFPPVNCYFSKPKIALP